MSEQNANETQRQKNFNNYKRYFMKKKKTQKFSHFSEQQPPKARKIKLLADEIANLDTVQKMYGFFKKMPNPDEILKNTETGFQVLRRLEREPQVAACILSRVAGVTSLKYRLKGGDKHKDFYEKLLKDLPVIDIIKDILKAPRYGYQPIEITWQLKDGFIVPKEIIAKPPEWFFYNRERQLCFNKKGAPDGFVILPEMKKFLCPTNEADYLNKYGKGYLSMCFWDVAFKKGSMEFWIKFAEKFGMPWIIAKFEQGTGDDVIENLLDTMEAMVQDAIAAIPDNSSVEIKEPSGKAASADIYKQLIETCDKNIAKTIVGQTLTTDVGDSGSYSLGQVHKKVLDAIVDSDKSLVEEQFKILFQWIAELNFGNEEDAPELELYIEEEIDQARAERDTKLHGMGVRFTKQYFTKAYGFDTKDFEIVETNTTIPMQFSEPESLNFASGEIEAINNAQREIDDFINDFSDEKLNEIISDKIQPILKNFAEKRDPQKILEDLAILFPEKNSDELEETLTKSIFLANLWGRINAPAGQGGSTKR